MKLFNHVRALTQSWKQYPTILIAQRHDTSLEGPRKDLTRTRTRHKEHRTEERRALGRARQTTDDDDERLRLERGGGRRGQLVDLATLSPPPPLQQLTVTDNAITAGPARPAPPPDNAGTTSDDLRGDLGKPLRRTQNDVVLLHSRFTQS